MIIITIVQIHLRIMGIFGLKEILGTVCIVLMKQLQTKLELYRKFSMKKYDLD